MHFVASVVIMFVRIRVGPVLGTRPRDSWKDASAPGLNAQNDSDSGGIGGDVAVALAIGVARGRRHAVSCATPEL